MSIDEFKLWFAKISKDHHDRDPLLLQIIAMELAKVESPNANAYAPHHQPYDVTVKVGGPAPIDVSRYAGDVADTDNAWGVEMTPLDLAAAHRQQD